MANLSIAAISLPTPGPAGLEIDGEIDLDTVDILKRALEEQERKGTTRLVLDMQKTAYANSAALAVLVRFAETFRGQGGGIAIARVTPRVKLVFEMLGLVWFFKFFDSVEKARASFGP